MALGATINYFVKRSEAKQQQQLRAARRYRQPYLPRGETVARSYGGQIIELCFLCIAVTSVLVFVLGPIAAFALVMTVLWGIGAAISSIGHRFRPVKKEGEA
jgi:hypothetical protein